jgi:hypothetical protein
MARKIDRNLAFWQFVLRRTWHDGLFAVLRQLLKVLSHEQPLDKAVVELFYEDLEKKSIAAERGIMINRASQIMVLNEVNLRPLKALLDQREQLVKRRLKDHFFILTKDEKAMIKFRGDDEWQAYLKRISIGRRGQDRIREIALSDLEKAFLQGSPVALGKNQIVENISKSVKTLNDDGIMRFELEVFPYEGKTRVYAVDQYAELVAKTTTAEATQVSFIKKAENLRTRLIKYNFIGKDYKKLNDDKCDKIDGEIFAINDGEIVTGQQTGKKYRSFRQVVGERFILPHPNCNHIARPFPEALA